MTDPAHPGDPNGGDELARFAARRVPASGAEQGACPDPGLVAGLAEGRLLEFEAADVTSHVAACAACRTLVAEMARGGLASEPTAGTPRRTRPGLAIRWFVGLAAAAGIVAAISIFAGRQGETRETVLASVHDLAEARPDLFEGFAPLTSGRSAPHSPARGALALFAPVGTVLDRRPEFRWEPVPGVTQWTVTLKTAEGDVIWTEETGAPSLRFPAARPALTPGTRYISDVRGAGPLGAEDAQRAFDVASDEERFAFEESAAEIERRVPARLRPLVLAQFALHRGLYAVARTEAERYVGSSPDDAFGQETLAAVRRAIGETSAEPR